jgi:hypothetical protein
MFQVVIASQVAREQFVEQIDLRIGNQHRHFRPGQFTAAAEPVMKFISRRQKLDLAIKPALRFEMAEQAGKTGAIAAQAGFCQRQTQSLQVVVTQDQPSHIVRHRRKQLVALWPGELAGSFCFAQRNLEIYLHV